MIRRCISATIVAIALVFSVSAPTSAQNQNEIGKLFGLILQGANQNNQKAQGSNPTKNGAATAQVAKPAASAADAAQIEANRAVQIALNYFGFPVGDADGDIGPKSRAAIAEFQAMLGFPATGALTEPERVFLVQSYYRGTAGGQSTQQQASANPLGMRGLLVNWHNEAVGLPQPQQMVVVPVVPQPTGTVQPNATTTASPQIVVPVLPNLFAATPPLATVGSVDGLGTGQTADGSTGVNVIVAQEAANGSTEAPLTSVSAVDDEPIWTIGGYSDSQTFIFSAETQSGPDVPEAGDITFMLSLQLSETITLNAQFRGITEEQCFGTRDAPLLLGFSQDDTEPSGEWRSSQTQYFPVPGRSKSGCVVAYGGGMEIAEILAYNDLLLFPQHPGKKISIISFQNEFRVALEKIKERKRCINTLDSGGEASLDQTCRSVLGYPEPEVPKTATELSPIYEMCDQYPMNMYFDCACLVASAPNYKESAVAGGDVNEALTLARAMLERSENALRVTLQYDGVTQEQIQFAQSAVDDWKQRIYDIENPSEADVRPEDLFSAMTLDNICKNQGPQLSESIANTCLSGDNTQSFCSCVGQHYADEWLQTKVFLDSRSMVSMQTSANLSCSQ